LALAAALAVSAACVAAEALLFRGMFDITRVLSLGFQRWWALAALIAFLGAVTILELRVGSAILRSGRRFEGLLRLRFLLKIPRLPDAYFRTRLMSDMAERAHATHLLGELPTLAGSLARAIFGLVFTVAGIVWLYPHAGVPAVAAAAIAVAVPPLATVAIGTRLTSPQPRRSFEPLPDRC
jgi:ATP-binding cassette subfamily B protein